LLSLSFFFYKAFTVPTIAPITTLNYTLSLATDPLTGPFTTTVNTTAGLTLNIRLTQVTVGIVSTVVVSFGDSSANQTFAAIQTGSPVNISHNYTSGGTFTISVFANATGLTGVNFTVNKVIVNVIPSPTFTG
jgi:hypothetical protein